MHSTVVVYFHISSNVTVTQGKIKKPRHTLTERLKKKEKNRMKAGDKCQAINIGLVQIWEIAREAPQYTSGTI